MQNIFILLIFFLLSGCAVKSQKNLKLDECTKYAGVLPQKEYRFAGVSLSNLDTQKAMPACKKRIAYDINDTQAKFLLARTLTKNTQYPEAFELILENLCHDGNDAECTLLAAYYFNGFTPVKRDRKIAIKLYEQACSNGYPIACLNLGKTHILGSSGVKNPELGAKLIFNECQNDIGVACYHFVDSMYFERIPFNQKQFDFAAKGSCKSGLSCIDFWKKYDKLQDKESVKINFDTTKKSCNNGLTRACNKIAQYYKQEKGAMQDYIRNQKSYDEDCENGNVKFGCVYTGITMLKQGQNPDKAIELIKKSCYKGKNYSACYDLGMIYSGTKYLNREDVISKDIEMTKKYLNYGCKKGNIRSCNEVDKLKKVH